MDLLLVIPIVIASLFGIGQLYLYSRRRKAGGLLRRLAGSLGGALRGNRIELFVGNHLVVLDAQVTRDDRPEELRLTVESNLPGDFRLTRPPGASFYDECKHRKPAAQGAPFAGWHVRSENPDQMVALASDRRAVELLEGLAELGFVRVELDKRKLRASWPSFSWKVDDHRWDAGDSDALPDCVRRAAGWLSELATHVEAVLLTNATGLQGHRVRATLAALSLIPVLLVAAGIFSILVLYDAYPTVRDGQLMVLMGLVGAGLSIIYTAIAYAMLRKSIQRGARSTLVGLLSFFGFSMGSAGPILWWNGTGPQGAARLLTVEVVRLHHVSALDSGRGRLLQGLIGKDTPIEEWSTTRRAIVQSWRDDSHYAITLNTEQFAALAPGNGRLSLAVHPGALSIEWYSDVAVVGRPETSDRNREMETRREGGRGKNR